MKKSTIQKLFLVLGLLFAATSPSWASTNYFISPTGSDGANGLSSGTAWLSPNHAVNCGDTVTAAIGTYSPANLGTGKWGTVTCPSSDNVAWLICATFDGCKVTGTTTDAVRVDKSYWGVVGWEAASNTTQSGACFAAAADSATTIHHIIFANDVANGCMGGGFTSYNFSNTAGVDYLVIIGNIVYNAAQGNVHCFSAISIYQPVASDSTAGTHMYVAGNFAYHTTEPNPCNGTTPTDGEAVIIDTLDGAQSGPQYNQQVVVQNNLGVFNGGMGFEIFNNQLQSTPAPIFFNHNTSVANVNDSNQTAGCLGRAELLIKLTKHTVFDHNLGQTQTGTSCSSAPIFASFVETVDATDTVPTGWYYSAAGHSTGTDNATGFNFGTITTTNPGLVNPVSPSAPSCGGTGSTPACMATVIANFRPTTSGASAFGYQTVSNTSITDSLFPQWLCAGTGTLNTSIPSGLITPGCGVATGTTGGSILTGFTFNGAQVR